MVGRLVDGDLVIGLVVCHSLFGWHCFLLVDLLDVWLGIWLIDVFCEL